MNSVARVWLSVAAAVFCTGASAHGTSDGIVAPPDASPAQRLEVLPLREGKDLLLYVDDYASNAPILGAQVDFRQGGRSLRAAPTSDGRYRLPVDVLDAAAPIMVSIKAGGIEQSVSIVLPEALPIEIDGVSHHRARLQTAVEVLLVLSALASLAVAFGRRRRRSDLLHS